jgi:SAM-dependent methyltransferase
LEQCREVVAEDWDAVAAQVDALPAGWRRQARREHLDLIDDWIGPPTGRWLKTDLFEEGSRHRALVPSLPSARWVGVDVSPVVVAGARAAMPAAVVADVRALPFREGSFDGVLSTSTLDHFDEAGAIDDSLRELARVLAPGALLLLTLDNAAHPLVRARNALPRSIARRTGLVPFAVGVTLDEDGGRQVLAAAGFELLRSGHVLHAPHVVATRLARFGWWERGVLPRFAALGRTRFAPRTGHFVAYLVRCPWRDRPPGGGTP